MVHTISLGFVLLLAFVSQALAQAPLNLEGSAAPVPWARYGDWTKLRWDSYNTLAKHDATPPMGKEIELKSVAGDAANGQKLAFDRSRGGGCLAYHVMGPRT